MDQAEWPVDEPLPVSMVEYSSFDSICNLGMPVEVRLSRMPAITVDLAETNQKNEYSQLDTESVGA
jgi:hypothetical protein